MTPKITPTPATHDGEALARAILTSRRTKCRVYGNHTEGGKCAGCGL